jgi:hypothetical protein
MARPCHQDLARPLETATPAQELGKSPRCSSVFRNRAEKRQHRLALAQADAGLLAHETRMPASAALSYFSGSR